MRTDSQANRRRLARTRWVLLLILIGICSVGTSWFAWPVVSWPMYATYEMPRQGPRAERTYLVAELTDGVTRRVELFDVLPAGWDAALVDIVDDAVADEPGPEARWTLLRMVSIHLGDRPVGAVEVRREVWDVEPHANPPLNRFEPRKDVLISRFVAPDLPADAPR